MTKYQVTFNKALLVLSCCWAVWSPMVPAATMNEHCVVSVLNRTVQVKPDGTWVLPNIPANFGPVRARATCVQDGATLSGQSEFFTIPANGSTDVPEIVLGPTTPIPNKITVTASTATLTQAGQTTQLTVTGHYADGSSQDLGNGATGTQFLVSNPQLATVSVNGLVTALQSGTVLIQAINEGAQGLLSMSIALSSDTDGDGILDDIELREGLDPNNPADALDDADRDGLTNKDELQRGTDLHKADSDGDGLLDGEEIKLGTNPLLKDTDGDGVPDNIEAATGSDPLNSLSFNLAKALKSISVSPMAFTINVNTVDLVAYQQLQVTGEFVLGGTINLTAKAKGTSYASSNLNACNFGVEDGRVYAGSNGFCTITVNNSGFTAAAIGTVKTFTPKALSYVSIPGFANNVEVSGNYAYIAAGSTGLQVVDVSNKTTPKVVASLDTPGNGNDVAVVGNYVYLADGAAGLRIIDIANPLTPTLAGVIDTPGIAWDVTVRGGYAFVADGTSGLQIIDVSNPAQPSLVGFLTLPGTAKGVDVDLGRRLAVVVAGTKGIYVVNINDVTTPILLGTSSGGDVRDVAVNGNYAFLADSSRSFTSVDISNPTAPVVRASTPRNLGGSLQDVALSGNFAIGADVAFLNHVPVIDISNPIAPLTRAIINFRGVSVHNDDGTGIAADASYLYLTAAKAFSENGVTGDTRLYIGQYRATINDNAGVAPTVSIISPANGDTVIQGQQIAISTQAADDVGVAYVIFNVNGTDVFTDNTAPYEAVYMVPDDAANLRISVDAVDFGGNPASSNAVDITAIPDPLTTVVGRVLDRNGIALTGAHVTCSNIEASTNTEGSFSVPGLSTIQGDISCSAVFNDGTKVLNGISKAVQPVRAANTDIGNIFVLESSQGKDFWLAHQKVISSGAQVIILSDLAAKFTISSTNFSYTGTVSPQSPALVPLPNSLQISDNQVVESKGIHITSDADVTALLYLTGDFNNEISLLIPTHILGAEYFAVGYQQSPFYNSLTNERFSEFVVISNQDDTHIALTPSCTSVGGTAAGSVLNLLLNRGQTYQYQCGNQTDVTGTRINSDKPVGVISGNACAAIPAGVGEIYCGVLSEMMFPVQNLYGTEFFSAPLPILVGNPDMFRIMAAYDGTVVTVDQGETQNTYQLNAGQFQELGIGQGAHFSSNRPVSVMQYQISNEFAGWANGPSQMQLLPTGVYKNTFRFYSPFIYEHKSWALITAPNTAVSSVTLNGQPMNALTAFKWLPGGTHQYALVVLPEGQSVVKADQPIAVYGIGSGSEEVGTYVYPAGF